ncbi:MAG: hypothetical protein ABI639_10690 [Thermoanaerobaculia bacterium]
MRRGPREENGGDPAAGLDRFELWLERALPPSPGPLWAEGLRLVVRLILGRASWVLGTLCIALGAPWFVFVHRQVDTMVRAAWYRSTATATATASVERVELRLLPGMFDGTIRVIPTVVLSFDAAPPASPDASPDASPSAPSKMSSPASRASKASEPSASQIRVRYQPRGKGLEAFHEWASSASLLYDPLFITPDWRFRWATAQIDAPGFDLLWSDRDADQLTSTAPWNGQTYVENALADLDRPIDLLVGDWTRRSGEGTRLPVRYLPGDAQRVFVADALHHLPPSGGNGASELVSAILLMLPFGLPFWWMGTRLVARGAAPRYRHYFFWVPLALLPFWGDRYLEILERLSPGAAQKNALLSKVGSSQVLPGSDPAGTGPSFDRRQRIDLQSSRFAATLALVDLRRPAKPAANGAVVWRDLEERFATALASADDAAFVRIVEQTSAVESPGGQPAMTPILAEGARRAALDPVRGTAARQAAMQLLRNLLLGPGLDLCHPSFPAYHEDLERLAEHPDAEIAASARQRLKEIDGWIADRQRDFGKTC